MNKSLSTLWALLLGSAPPALSAPTAVTYQGQLKKDGQPVSEVCDVAFRLVQDEGAMLRVLDAIVFDGINDGPPITIANGLFSARLNFSSAHLGEDNLFLRVSVRCPHSPTNAGTYTHLLALHPLTAVPYSRQVQGMFVDDQDRIGMGTTTPEARLHVAGDAIIDGQIVMEATTRQFSISAASFTPLRNSVFDWTEPGGQMTDAGDLINSNARAVAGVELPDGAVLTDFRAYIRDDDLNRNIRLRLVRDRLLGSSNVQTDIPMADVESSGTPGYTTLSDETIAAASIDNGSYSYFIWAEWQTGDIALRGVRITYTVTAPLP